MKTRDIMVDIEVNVSNIQIYFKGIRW